MKLRIKGNSIRLRLTRPEVARVAADGWLEGRTDFLESALCFALAAKSDASALGARFENDTIVIAAPKAAVSDWAAGEEVGLYGEQPTSTGEILSIAVEKDFRCLDRSRAEGDEADAYPHPAIKPRGS